MSKSEAASQQTASEERSPAARPARSSRGAAPKFYVGGFWVRALAGLVDIAIILPIAIILCKVASALADLHIPPSRVHGLDFWLDLLLAGDPALLGAIGLTLAIACTYSMIFHISMGRTPGMRVLKLRIIDVYGDDPSMPRALARTAGYLLSVASLGLGFLWIAFDSEKRGLQDWLAGTYVVKVSS